MTASAVMHVPFVDLRAQHAHLAAEIQTAVQQVFERGDFIHGAEVERFEAEYAEFIGTRHAIGVGTGLAAIELALRAFGIGPGDEVIAPANTFIATVLAIVAAGARPVLVDMDRESYTIDPAALAAAVTYRTRAIVPVHLYGQPVDLDAVLAVATRHHLVVIEDAAQAHGARYKGKRIGRFGHAAAFSFYPSKNLGAYGDGGMIVTDDDRVAAKLRLLSNYGQRAKYDHAIAGTNSRLDTVQAAVLRVKLPYLDGWNADADHIYHLYVIETTRRDELQRALHARGIHTGIHYPVPVHLQGACADLGHRRGDFPATEAAAARILSLPMYPELTDGQVDYVASAVTENAASAA
jgi:dTDP-4-amino-4,6-dideoxygalactose transaminase